VSAAPRVTHQSPKQHAASVSNLVKARAAQRRSGALHHHTARQRAASRQNLVRARAAQASRRGGKTPVSSKSAQAPLAVTLEAGCPGWRTDPQLDSPGSLHSLPVCAAVAVAASLREQTGIVIPDESLLAWHESVQGGRICDLLEYASVEGLAGRRLVSFQSADPDLFFPGLICGIWLSIGYHAVLTTRGGMLSWGMVLPLLGTPEEAWILDWEEP
jgi:hypothetical protein